MVDTGSSISVFPRKLILQGIKSVKYALLAINGTSISTYGWLTVKLHLGLHLDFEWRFLVADVSYPVIGLDFLSHFGLLVDCANRRLLCEMSVFAKSQASSSQVSKQMSSPGPATAAPVNKDGGTEVFIPQDARCRSLESLYSGPDHDQSQTVDKMQLSVEGKLVTVSIDRLKPVHVLIAADGEDTATLLSPPVKRTRFGRHIRAPACFNA
jgi:hypothetical protein